MRGATLVERGVAVSPYVLWRTSGHQLDTHGGSVLRFEVADLNQVIKAAVAASPLYVPLLERGGLRPEDRVLPLSCFALTPEWTPSRLARGTRYRSYRQVEARVLLAAGYPLWPTAVYDDNGPDLRNEVHYDLIALAGTDLRLHELAGGREDRADARARLAPRFMRVLELLGEPLALSDGGL